MLIFHGLDNFLLNQAVNNYLKQQNYLNNYFSTYYLELENFEITITNILTEITSYDLLNNKKVVVINDYDGILSNNISLWKIFNEKLQEFAIDNIIILKCLIDNFKPEVLKFNHNFFPVPSLNKTKLKNWLIEKSHNYYVDLSETAIEIIINEFPNSLNVISNELKKFHSLPKQFIEEQIKKISKQYFVHNPYQLISLWLKKDYQAFFFNIVFFEKKLTTIKIIY